MSKSPPHLSRPTGHLRIAQATTESMANHTGATFRCSDPRVIGPWGIVTNVLIVTALEVRHPMLFFVQVKANDPPIHGEQGA